MYYSVMNFPKLLLVIAVQVLLALNLAAQTASKSVQQRTVTKAEIEKLEAAAKENLKTLPYHKKTTHRQFYGDERSPYYDFVGLQEFLRPNRFHSIDETKDTNTAFLGKRIGSRSEYIAIGKKTYLKKNNGPWKVLGIMMADSFNLDLPPIEGIKIEYEYLYLGEQILNGIVSDQFRITKKEALPKGRADFVLQTLTEKTLWFDKKGRFLKIQTDTVREARYGAADKLHREDQDYEVTEYEYDIPIKIGAPIK
jgi:hypothetical protein